MARPPRPERKSELLEQILDFLLDKTLADLTFRSLADGLGISSYVLVYHFGNREALVSEIIRGIESRFDPYGPGADRLSVDGLILWARAVFEHSLDHRGRHLQRLEFEAAVQDVVAPQPRGNSATGYLAWCRFLTVWLEHEGVPADEAAVLGRTFVAALTGVLYDYVIFGDRPAVTASFEKLVDAFIRELSASRAPLG
ncbi:TetR/AcrR family transcriptional regulator [Sinomonas sp. ASV322]|uniref:TetR/AcrR family transcriptional regulator n=1 Tax=Sinomonas sp. ASV322 TaxID=3041920 RepID=UPI0027DBD01B|nr:TetR/AcrR family transcriptional regulator [Sinomonas sp. ASV322]MDQ4501709.1 TetR/AcrR family transcriptional regulator [Sinomonas sp. ASV322]